MATAWLEPIFSYIRVGADGAKHYDDFHLISGVRYLSPDIAEVCGLRGTITKDDWKALKKTLGDSGLKRVFFKRVRRDKAGQVVSIQDHWVELETTTREVNVSDRFGWGLLLGFVIGGPCWSVATLLISKVFK